MLKRAVAFEQSVTDAWTDAKRKTQAVSNICIHTVNGFMRVFIEQILPSGQYHSLIS
jgi:hypothetical protein